MAILPNAEKQGGPVQIGGWHKEMARRRYQRGSVRKRGAREPVWELQWWEDYIKPDGTIGRKRESRVLGPVSAMTRRQASRAAEEFLAPLNAGKKNPLSTILFRDFVDRFFVPNFFPTLKPSTRKRYTFALEKHLKPAFGESRLCDIGTLEIQKFVLSKLDMGLGWESCDHFKNLMSKIFAMAKRWGLFSGDNPASGVQLPEKKPVREKHALTPEQFRQLMASVSEPYRTMFLVGILAGLRVGEILGLRWKDIDLARGELRVEQAIYRGSIGSPKTKGSRRTLPLPEALASVLERFKADSAQRSDNDLVFCTRKGTAYSDTNILHRVLKPAGKKIGAPWLSWHVFRRTHATLLQAAGGSLKDAQAQLGHTRMSLTSDLYTVPLPAHQREAVENLSRMVTNGDELQPNADRLPMPTTRIQ